MEDYQSSILLLNTNSNNYLKRIEELEEALLIETFKVSQQQDKLLQQKQAYEEKLKNLEEACQGQIEELDIFYSNKIKELNNEHSSIEEEGKVESAEVLQHQEDLYIMDVRTSTISGKSWKPSYYTWKEFRTLFSLITGENIMMNPITKKTFLKLNLGQKSHVKFIKSLEKRPPLLDKVQVIGGELIEEDLEDYFFGQANIICFDPLECDEDDAASPNAQSGPNSKLLIRRCEKYPHL
ncbi:unnamed protein product [Moneuplotes crassus]|uniref:Uncharacterized protein n=1 Tax=Euplotes crassus TaxID=5936 RepID=A0AAD1U448_EUPCR|nr:unnamed protein product [Moneuplotes crassus]